MLKDLLICRERSAGMDMEKVIVSGKTFYVKETLKALGYKWNAKDKIWEQEVSKEQAVELMVRTDNTLYGKIPLPDQEAKKQKEQDAQEAQETAERLEALDQQFKTPKEDEDYTEEEMEALFGSTGKRDPLTTQYVPTLRNGDPLTDDKETLEKLKEIMLDIYSKTGYDKKDFLRENLMEITGYLREAAELLEPITGPIDEWKAYKEAEDGLKDVHKYRQGKEWGEILNHMKTREEGWIIRFFPMRLFCDNLDSILKRNRRPSDLKHLKDSLEYALGQAMYGIRLIDENRLLQQRVDEGIDFPEIKEERDRKAVEKERIRDIMANNSIRKAATLI